MPSEKMLGNMIELNRPIADDGDERRFTGAVYRKHCKGGSRQGEQHEQRPAFTGVNSTAPTSRPTIAPPQ